VLDRPEGKFNSSFIYYIRYWKNGRQIEEMVGRQFKDYMTPAKAQKIRIECIEGRCSARKVVSKGKRNKQFEEESCTEVSVKIMQTAGKLRKNGLASCSLQTRVSPF
jgi:hypothetical protein